MPDRGEPKRRSAKVVAPEVAAKLEAKLTVELSTSDLEELGQAGEIAQTRNGGDRKVDDRGGVIVSAPARQPAAGPSASVFVDLGEAPPQKISEARRATEPPLPKVKRAGGAGLVVIVYLLSAAALAAALYERYWA